MKMTKMTALLLAAAMALTACGSIDPVHFVETLEREYAS